MFEQKGGRYDSSGKYINDANRKYMGVNRQNPAEGDKQFARILINDEGGVGSTTLYGDIRGGMGAANDFAARKTVKQVPRGGRILG